MNSQTDQFIEFILQESILKFGEFTLKSGRVSPYFFNMGNIQTGKALRKLGEFYAHTIQAHQLKFDVLLGPAYKGIPIAASTAIALDNLYGQEINYCFNRKEAKTHGEGGSFVGAPPQGKILLVDDVITAGTAVEEIINLLKSTPKAQIAGLVIALDRQEKAINENQSAVEKLTKEHNIPVYSVTNFTQIISHLENDLNTTRSDISAMKIYRNIYGTK